jgi:inner membrane protease ATP23
MTEPIPPPPVTTTAADKPLNSAQDIDTSFYSWQTWFRALSGQLTPAERQQYLQARDLIKESSDCARCETYRDWLLQNSPTVTFLRRQIRSLGPDDGSGPDIDSSNVRCRRCTTRQGGGFDSDYGILLCANEMRNRKHVEDTMAHEMVHAYDHLRWKVERWDLRHQACTEVRLAAVLCTC